MIRDYKQKSNAKKQDSIERTDASFLCAACGKTVDAAGAGSAHRNHCPHCLASRHLDNEPGDRAADCGGIMDAVAVWVRRGGEWAIVHRCRLCGTMHSNRIAADDSPLLLMSLAVKPLATPPFPLDRFGEMTGLAGDGDTKA